MTTRNFALCSTILVFASGIPLCLSAADEVPSYSGTWQAADKSSELVVEQTGDSVHVREQRGPKLLCEYTCNSSGKDCSFKQDGKKATVSVYFNGPKMVEVRTHGDVVIKRRFGLTNEGKNMEVELMPIVPPGKSETVLYAKQ